jgi:hypothetical protein
MPQYRRKFQAPKTRVAPEGEARTHAKLSTERAHKKRESLANSPLKKSKLRLEEKADAPLVNATSVLKVAFVGKAQAAAAKGMQNSIESLAVKMGMPNNARLEPPR